MTDFLANLEHLFSPIHAWGEFRRGARPAAVAFVLFERDGAWKVPFVRRRADDLFRKQLDSARIGSGREWL